MNVESKMLESHKKLILGILEKELRGGPVVVRSRDLPRFEVSRLDGDVLVGRTAGGANLRIPYDNSIGPTGARCLTDPDSPDWWILFGPPREIDPTRPHIDNLSNEVEPSLDDQVRLARRKQQKTAQAGAPHE
ncbi:MAG: hypothetical protein WC876_07795 [Candidatus Thermoplasmatota archaeon]